MVSVLAPTRGLDDTSPQALVEAGYAVELVNMWPTDRSVDVRPGFSRHATAAPSDVQSLLVWRGWEGAHQLKAATAGAIYDATGAGEIGDAEVDDLSNGRWASVNFSTPAGAFLVAVNGADGVRTFNGTAWATQTITGGDAEKFADVVAHQTRLWFVERDSARAWYLAPRSIAGAATAFEFGGLWSRGGHLATLATWTRDSGAGADDHLVAVSSAGQIAVFSGTDPNDAAAWRLEGVYNGPAPVGARCALGLGGDVLLLTTAGVVSLAALVQSSAAQVEAQAWTRRIERTIKTAAATYGTLPGWQITEYPAGGMVLVNIPSTPATQVACNVAAGGWTTFAGMNATQWAAAGDKLYFCAGTEVFAAWSGWDDDGSAVEYVMRTAPALLSGGVTHVTMTLTYLETESSPPPRVRINTDFDDAPPTSAAAFQSGAVATWDTAAWDEAAWPGVLRPLVVKQGSGGAGRHISVHARGGNRNSPLRFIGFDLLDRAGGRL